MVVHFTRLKIKQNSSFWRKNFASNLIMCYSDTGLFLKFFIFNYYNFLFNKVSLYLFKELPLYLWRPSASEIAVIRDWLLNYNLTMVKNKLACIILEGLNWGFDEQVCV